MNRKQQRRQYVEQSVQRTEKPEVPASDQLNREENFWLQHSGVTSDEHVRNTALAGLRDLLPGAARG